MIARELPPKTSFRRKNEPSDDILPLCRNCNPRTILRSHLYVFAIFTHWLRGFTIRGILDQARIAKPESHWIEFVAIWKTDDFFQYRAVEFPIRIIAQTFSPHALQSPECRYCQSNESGLFLSRRIMSCMDTSLFAPAFFCFGNHALWETYGLFILL